MLKIIPRSIQDVPTLEVIQEELINEPLPLVIFYHGWRSAKEQVLTQARKLAQKNIRVVLPDAPNHGERHVDVSSVPSVTFWNSIQGNLSEFSLICQYYQKNNLIKDQKIGVGGYSMGGITTAALLTQHPEITAATVIMGTPNLKGYAQLIIDDAKKRNLYMPVDFDKLIAWIDNYDLNSQPEKINRRPVLFWHGTKDPRIPYRMSKDFFDNLQGKTYGEQVAFITGYRAGHLVEPRLMDKIANFFEYYLE